MKNTTKQKMAEKAVQKLIKISLQQIEGRLFEFISQFLTKHYNLSLFDNNDKLVEQLLIEDFREFYDYE